MFPLNFLETCNYTDLQIYNTLGKQLQNIVTDSEEQTATYLKEKLSYIKDAHITKHVMKRMLTIEITERNPFALLRVDSTDSKNHSFFLVDNEAHVLKHIETAVTGPSIPDQFRERVVPQDYRGHATDSGYGCWDTPKLPWH